ncbi:serine hydrolase domain-containing protein [Reichenbachiella ulvae]|uniref:Beta-lactamase family protein n=1 Tax=Reichenbachiella ulvae TaxID=2980104 RepID=A0ABT3CN48_9BACT|nr:serine hydrolase domain-containing protein [Reichenbachiella ulvae]MCV9385143.1 beta-lactamase family protein [Reichenbachiella ulvae]
MACQPQTETKENNENLVIDQVAKNRIDSTLQSFVSEGMVVGASALIFEKGKEAYFNAYGYADREAKIPMDRNTIVTIFSMTKPLTGTALMSLWEEGAFQLEEPLSKYAPEFSDMQVATELLDSGKWKLEPTTRPISIADITRHSAGFSTRSDLGLDQANTAADLYNLNNTLKDMAQDLSQLPLGFQPGTRWEYGISVDVQAYLIEQLSGRPFDEYMQETVLDPLGMSETSFFVPEDRRQRMAALYFKTDSSINRIPDEQSHAFNYAEWPMKPGGWGLTSTLDDYMKFAQMLVNEGTYRDNTILQPETVKLMATNHLPAVEDSLWLPGKGRVGFGIDFAVRTEEPQNSEEMNGTVGEFFWDGAGSTLFWVDPKNELTAVLFVQIFPFNGTIHKQFRDAVYGPIKD